MTTTSIILLVLSAVIMTIFIMITIYCKDGIPFIIGIVLNSFLFGLPICVTESKYPNKRDVKKGNAIFVKYDYKTIKNNDTVSYTIYEIEWKENK